MKILIVTQYFWPESFKINDLALGLKERGHEVAILTAIPNYPKGFFFENYSFWKNNDEEWNGIKIYRSKIFSRGKGSLRLMLNYISFVFFCSIKVFFIKEKFDKIFVYEPSPITVGIPAIVAGRKMKIPFYFWVQDLWPESLSAAGGIKNKFILNAFDWITKRIYRNAEKILVQSKGFEDYINGQGDFKSKLIYYPNSAENLYKPLIPTVEYESKLPEGFKLLFAGNLGEAQGIDTLIEAAEIVKENNIEVNWIFLGDGRQKQYYINKVKEKGLESNFYFLGSFPADTMPSFFCCSDALIVSLKKDKIFSLTIPSKLQSYLACGKPILASLDGEGAKIVQESKAGFASPAEDAQTFAANVIKFYNLSLKERAQMQENALEYFKNEFEREKLIDKLLEILKK
ncbi:glycosyltransferase family 4 protein [Flavobacterium lipolyticum]|uniref:Glycosyltransferase family 4 protein n=1 Tax=Flavobacterium lipolyticum TaxID=2893754 RepID=A0ABS8LX84_9FLAO|nr:glycosyltransferase family 4 protein [Flavobacterium sp. F-126]MCC9017154.1 glycosyltransferase family 4 protein [Flavobacterium sp. F-126]